MPFGVVSVFETEKSSSKNRSRVCTGTPRIEALGQQRAAQTESPSVRIYACMAHSNDIYKTAPRMYHMLS